MGCLYVKRLKKVLNVFSWTPNFSSAARDLWGFFLGKDPFFLISLFLCFSLVFGYRKCCKTFPKLNVGGSKLFSTSLFNMVVSLQVSRCHKKSNSCNIRIVFKDLWTSILQGLNDFKINHGNGDIQTIPGSEAVMRVLVTFVIFYDPPLTQRWWTTLNEICWWI